MNQLRNVPKCYLFICFIGLVIIVGNIALFMSMQTNRAAAPNQPSDASDSWDTVTEGRLTCLLPRDTGQPTTLECAYGIKSPQGEHYALDTSAFDPALFSELTMDQTIAVTGKVTPLAAVLDTSVKKYDIVGVIQVFGVEKKQ